MPPWQHDSTRARHRAPHGIARREAPVGASEAKVTRREDPRADSSARGETRREAAALGDSTWPPQQRRASGPAPTRDLRVTCRSSDQTERSAARFSLDEAQGFGRHRFLTSGYSACAAAERRDHRRPRGSVEVSTRPSDQSSLGTSGSSPSATLTAWIRRALRYGRGGDTVAVPGSTDSGPDPR